MAARALSSRERSKYEANLWKFYLFRFLVDFQLWLPIWVIYLQKERGLSLSQITLLDAPFWLVLVFMEIPTGAVADRFGRKTSLMWGAAANSIAVLIFGIAGNFFVLLISYLAWAVAWTLYSGADSAFFFDSLKALGRESEFQKLWGRSRAIMSVGAFLGLLIGAPLADATTLWFPVVASAALMAGAWLVSLTFHEPPRLDEGEEQLSYLEGTKKAALIVYRHKSLRYMMLLAAAVMAVGISVSILAQPFLDSHDVDVGNFGWFLIPGNLLGIVAALVAYRVTAAIGVTRIFSLLPLAVIVTAAGLGAWDSLGAFVFYPIGGMVMAMSFPMIASYLNERIPSSQRATILSFHQLSFSLFTAVIEPVLGAIGDKWGLPVAYRVAAIVMALLAGPLLVLWIRAHRSEVLLSPEELDNTEVVELSGDSSEAEMV